MAATSRRCLPQTDVYVRSLAVLTALGSRPLVLDQHVHICFHLHAECPARGTARANTACDSGDLLAVCVPQGWGPPAPSRAHDGHAVPGALDQQLGVEAHLVPNAWEGAQADFGKGVVQNFRPGWLRQGKGTK